MSLYSKDNLYYIEYLDHMRTDKSLQDLRKNPPILWCCGKIFNEDGDFLAVLCSGIRDRAPSTEPTYEIIFKKAIIKKQLIYQVDSPQLKSSKDYLDKREKSIHFVSKISKSGRKRLINIPMAKFNEIPKDLEFFKVYIIPIKF